MKFCAGWGRRVRRLAGFGLAVGVLLGAGMRCRELFEPVEGIVGEPVLAYLSFDARPGSRERS